MTAMLKHGDRRVDPRGLVFQQPDRLDILGPRTPVSSGAFLDQPKDFVTQPSVVWREPVHYFSEGDDRLPNLLVAA